LAQFAWDIIKIFAMEELVIKQLDFLIGKWNTNGTVEATGTTPATTFKGTDTYEYVLDEQFILHTVDVLMGGQRVKTLELIGINKERQEFVLNAFDNSGGTGKMTALLVDGVLHISDENMRSRLTVVDPYRKMAAVWEKSADGKNWEHWMTLELSH
jgi:hypothetical protein